MSMTINLKLGTLPVKVYYVKFKRKPPDVGDIIWVGRGLGRNDWQRAKIDRKEDVGGRTVYFAYRY